MSPVFVLLGVSYILLLGWVWMLDRAVHNVLDLLNDIAEGNWESGQEDDELR